MSYLVTYDIVYSTGRHKRINREVYSQLASVDTHIALIKQEPHKYINIRTYKKDFRLNKWIEVSL